MSARTLVVCGHGPGISNAVARRFGSEGYAVALVARDASRLAAAAEELARGGARAAAVPCDLADAAAVRAMIGQVQATLGPISVLHWNAYAAVAGDLLTADPSELRTALDVGVVGLVTAVQAALDDLRANRGSVLITGGGFALYDERVDAMATRFRAMGLAVTKAAQHKLAGLLANRLEGEGVYLGEVVVTGMVKGTAFDSGAATLEPSTVADKFWAMHAARGPHSTTL